MASLEGRVEFDHPVHFLGDCLGLVSSLKVGGVSGSIGLPTPPAEIEFKAALSAPAIANGSVLGAIPSDVQVPWGALENVTEHDFVAQRAYVIFEIDDRLGDVQEQAEHVEYLVPWFLRNVWTWLEVVTSQDLYPYERPTRERPRSNLNSLYLFDDAGGSELIRKNEGIFMWPVDRDTYVSAEHWRFALDAASGGKNPPLEYLMFRDAQRALVREQFRRAVMDAGSAAEIAVTNALRTKLLEDNQEEVVEQLLRSNVALARRVSLARKFGFDIPSDVKTALIEPRNNAAHKGSEPDGVTAMQAVDMARQIIRTVLVSADR